MTQVYRQDVEAAVPAAVVVLAERLVREAGVGEDQFSFLRSHRFTILSVRAKYASGQNSIREGAT